MEPSSQPSQPQVHQEPDYQITVEQSGENFRSIRIIRYAAGIVLLILAVLLLNRLFVRLSEVRSMQIMMFRVILMSLMPLFVTSILFLSLRRGIRTFSVRRERNVRSVQYVFYGDRFEIRSGATVKRYGYDRLKHIYHFLDYLVLGIRGARFQFLPPQSFASPYQMMQFEDFIQNQIQSDRETTANGI